MLGHLGCTREMGLFRVHFEQFGPLSIAKSLAMGPFSGRKWLKMAQNKTKMFFLFVVGSGYK